MYKDFGKDELIILAFICITSVMYRISEDCKIKIISSKIMIIILMLSIAYLFFNRVIKLMIDMVINKNNFYDAVLTVKDIIYKPVGRSSYEVYIVTYDDADNNSHIKEIHSSFSIKKWKIGDEIKIRVSKNNSDTIIIAFSDLLMAIIMSIMGMIFENILFTVYFHIK